MRWKLAELEIAALLWVALTAMAFGQAASDPGPAIAQGSADRMPLAFPTAPPDGHSSGPDVYLLPDDQGVLRRVLGFRYEEFQRALRMGAQSSDTEGAPRWALASLHLVGKAEREIAQVRLEMEVRLESSGWIEVDLGLGSLAISKAEIVEANSDDFFAVGRDGRSLTAWVRGEAGERRRLIVEGETLLRIGATDQTFQLELPSAVSSTVELEIPFGDALAESNDGTPVRVEPVDANRSLLRALARGGLLSLHWRPREIQPTTSEAPYEASQRLLVHVDRRRVRYDVALSLQAFGRALDRVEVALPPGASLVSQQSSGAYALNTVREAPGERTKVEIRFSEPQSTIPLIRLVAEQALEGRTADAQEVGGVVEGDEFSTFRVHAPLVLGAIRQSGVIAVSVNDDLLSYYESEGGVERIAVRELPDELQEKNPRAAFEFAAAEWSVDVHTSPSQRRARVRPRYVLNVTSQGVEMEVEYDYRIVGGRTFDLELDLQGWEFREWFESGGSVSRVGTWRKKGVLSLPLNDPDTSQVRLRFALHRDLARTPLGKIRLPLPLALDAFMLPATIELTSDSSLQVTPRIDESQGVALLDAPQSSRETEPTGVALEGAAAAKNSISPLVESKRAPVQRLRAYLRDAVLAIDVAVRPREVQVQQRVDVAIGSGGADVRQSFAYRVDYQPADELQLQAPSGLAENDSLQFFLNDALLPPEKITWRDYEAAERGARNVVIRLPRPTQGEMNLVLKFRMPLENRRPPNGKAPLENVVTRTLIVPLARADQETTGARAVVTAPPRWRVATIAGDVASAWSADGESESPADGRLSLRAEREVSELTLAVTDPAGTPSADVVIDRLWVQSWIAGDVRQDRHVLRFSSASDRVRLALPEDVNNQNAELICDGVVVPISLNPSGLVEAPLGERSAGHVVELHSQRPHRLGIWSSLEVEPMRIDGARQTGLLFWQVVTPPHYATLSAPRGWTSEYELGWRNFQWGRQPIQEQATLEEWAGASPRPSPSPMTSRYVYSGFSWPKASKATVVRRAWLLAPGALALFGAGWLAIASTGLVRVGVTVLAACVVVGVMVWRIEAGVALLQAAALALALTSAAWWLRRRLDWSTGPAVETIHGQGASGIAPGPTRAWPAEGEHEGSPVLPSTAALPTPTSMP